MVNRVPADSRRIVDEFVEAYESARQASRPSDVQRVDLRDYLPGAAEPCYPEVAAELIRVDMEYSWNQGENKRLADYQAMLPEIFRNQEVRGQVAYEEYRLRAQAGDQVSVEQYGRLYGVKTDLWSCWSAPQQQVSQVDELTSPESPLPQLWHEALELPAEVQNFPVVGDAFSGFSLEQELGRGAFSHVFLARQNELAERRVVLKIASGTSLEPQHLARLQHTNIVPIYSVHRHEQLTAVCMPYFGHRTLADLLAVVRQQPDTIGSQRNLISTFLNQRDPTEQLPVASPSQLPVRLPQQEHSCQRPQETEASVRSHSKVLKVLTESSYVDAVIWFVQQMAEGLAHAHERGIVHRDLKPANVLLTEEGLPMLLDFNLSEDVVVHGRTSLLVGGTLPYMSPEQLEAVTTGEPIGYQADLFSLGVIFYELLTGERPFHDFSGAFDNVVGQMIAERRQGRPLVRGKNFVVPRSIEAVVGRCLAPNREQRYRTAGELVEDLDRHFRDQPLLHAPDRSVAERSKKWLKRHPRVSSAAGVAALASCGLLLMLGFWIVRGNRLARLEAEDLFHEFLQQQPSLQMALGVPHTDPQNLADGIARTRQELGIYAILDDDLWQQKSRYQALSQSDQEQLHDRMGELLYMTARASEELLAVQQNRDNRVAMISESSKLNRLARDLFSPQNCPRALLQQQARLLDLVGSTDEAARIRRLATTQPNKDVIDQYAEVYDYHDAKDYHQAKPLLLALREHSPADPVPWLLLGDVNAGLGAFAESEACLTTAVVLEPGAYMGYFQRGLCRLQLKHYQGALDDFQEVIRLRPQLPAGYLNRALAQRFLGNLQEAIADLTKALQLGATQTRIYFIRSKLRRRMGDPDGAEADVAIGLERTPSDELSWVSRGVAQLEIDPEAALADFQQALQINPASSTALHNCVHVLADRLNKQEEALETVNQLLQLNEHDTDALAGRAVLSARAGNRQAAAADIRQLLLLSKAPKDLFQGACVFSLTSEFDESDSAKALTLLARAVQLEPNWFARAHTDPDLKRLRETPAFREFVANTRRMNRLQIELRKSPSQE